MLFLQKFTFQSLSLVNAFFILIVLPRAFGPELYAQYSLVLSTGLFLVQSLIAGLSPAFLHFINDPKKQKLQTAVNFFLIFIFLFLVIIVIIATTFLSENLKSLIWKSNFTIMVTLLIIFISYLRFLEEKIIQFGDIIEKTWDIELLRFYCRTGFTTLIVLSWWVELLSLGTFIILNVFSWTIFFFLSFKKIVKFKVSHTLFKDNFLQSLFKYSWKIYLFLMMGALYLYLGRYFLALDNSFEEQAQFYAGFQLGTVVLPIIASFTALMMKKFSQDHYNDKIFDLRVSFFKINVLVSAVFLLVISPLYFLSGKIVYLSLGPGYSGAVDIFCTILIFSWLQCPGTVNINFFASTNRTGELSLLQNLTAVIGIIVIIWFYTQTELTPINLARILVGVYGLKVVLLFSMNIRYLLYMKPTVIRE